MTNRSRIPISFSVEIRAEHPEFLRGLDLWLQLGLISDVQVRRLAMSQLCCKRPLPEPQSQPSDIPSVSATLQPLQGEFVLATEPDRSRPPKPPKPQAPSLIAQILGSFMAEISVVWLLFLGVFLVVVSSAVLAASQWQNVSAVGQYGILWSYTIAFGLAGLWTATKENLRLTSRMLQVTTLLIIPVNFWMMDGFRLWTSPIGWVMGLWATATLSGLQFWLLRSGSRLTWLNSLGLSWLHWGWSLAGISLAATYLGTIGTAALQLRDRAANFPPSTAPPAASGESQNLPTSRFPLDIGQITIAFATLLLIGRATLAVQVPIGQLGLALGICGWLVLWQRRSRVSLQPVQEAPSARSTETPLWTWVGTGLLLFGWLVAVTDQQLWQALGCSGLGLGLLWDRLHRRWQKLETVGLILVGVQSYALLRVIFPPTVRSWILAQVAHWVQLELGAWELTGLGFFPCLLAMWGFAIYLDRRDRPSLSRLTRQIALVFGFVLAVPGLLNPGVRALYGLLSSGLLAGVLLYRRDRSTDPHPGLIYLTHTNSVLTGVFWVLWLAPNLEARVWATILLAGMVLEWAICLRASRVWQTSAWAIGLGLALCGDLALFLSLLENPYPATWMLLCLTVPGMLTVLGRSRSFPYRDLANGLGVGAVLLSPLMMPIDQDVFLVGAAIGTGLLSLQTQGLRHWLVARLTIGSGLVFVTTLLLRIEPHLEFEAMLVWLGGLLWGLGLLKWILERQFGDRADRSLPSLYRDGSQFWTIALSLVNLLSLTGIAAANWQDPTFSNWQPLVATGLTTTAIGLFQTPTNLSCWGIAWGVELVIILLTDQLHLPIEFAIITNLALALTLQVGQDLWHWKQPTLADRIPWNLAALDWIPLAFAAIGVGLGHETFAANTGLYSIAGALPVVGLGRRRSKLLTYLGLLGLTIGAYELLLYPLLHAPAGGAIGDAVTLLAGLALLLAVIYRSLSQRLTSVTGLDGEELRGIGHIHWDVGTILAGLALLLPRSNLGGSLWMGVVALLAIYAIVQGRRDQIWIYVGVGELWAVIGDGLVRWLPNGVLLEWSGAIAAVLGFITYALPWRNWGWADRPWRICAIGLPALVLSCTAAEINVQSLLISGAFYAWIAWKAREIRLSYFSLGLAMWTAFRLLLDWQFSDPLWYVSVISAAMLYIVQVEPNLQSQTEKEQRHWLRCLAIGLLAITAFYQSEASWIQGLLTIGLGIGLGVLGLTFRVRAFLYVGTLTFVLKVLRQLWLFISDYSLLLWGLGIILGLVLIWIAATFEARRSQAIALMQYWITELEAWE